jgi:apolipoprotein N-acyltransferase
MPGKTSRSYLRIDPYHTKPLDGFQSTLRLPPAVAFALALLSSLLFILAFPSFDRAGAAWVSLFPLIVSAWLSNRARAFWLGFSAGLVAYSGILYWLIPTFLAAHQSIILALFCIFGLSAYLALYWGTWTWIISWLPKKPLLLVITGSAAWVALEFIRTYLFSGFPWALLGDSQVHHLFTIQIASITGVYGVSFLVVLVNLTLAALLFQQTPSYSSPSKAWSIIPSSLVAGCILYGWYQFHPSEAPPPAPPSIRVALLQGSIDQYKKWDRAYVQEIQQTYEALSRQAAAEHADLIVWPETSVPGYLLQDPPLHEWLNSVIQSSTTQALNLIGAPAMHGPYAYNSAFLINTQGQVLGEYAKQHLVPFGETVPFGRFLGRWIRVLNDLGGFAAGTQDPILQASSYKIGINICYEAIFPSLVRRSVLEGADLIANITNDGWYMQTAAPYQHLTPNIMRAVENRRWLIRADNTGVSAFIDPYGRIVAQTPIFKPTSLIGQVEPRADITAYTRFGDIFAWICLALTALVFLAILPLKLD